MKNLPISLGQFFWHFIKQQTGWLLVTQLLCFCWAFDQFAVPYALKLIIDAISNYHGNRLEAWAVILPPALLGLCFWFLIEIGYRSSGFMMAYAFPKLEAAVRMNMFNYVQYHSHNYFSENLAGSLANKISDMTLNMSMMLQMIMTTFVPACVAMIFAFILFFSVQATFAWILLIWIIFHLSVCLLSAKHCDDLALRHSEARSTLIGKIVDCFSNIAGVRLFARYQYEYEYLESYQVDERRKNWRVAFFIERIKIILTIGTLVGPGIITTFAAIHEWQYGRITVGDLIFIINTTRNMLAVVWIVGLLMPQLFRQIGICRQALTIVQTPYAIVDAADAKILQVTAGEIVFKNVDFHYAKYHLFQNKTVTIPAGKKIGLVGFSGSGKTTFVNLILRLFDLSSGQIFIDNQDISQVTQISLREQIAMIPQESVLFHRSIIENIRYGRPSAIDVEVIDAAKQAHCHEFITQLPDGYQTLVGERGSKISGGQRQRIAIARAILKNAPILILDEATSALDSITEKYIQDTLQELMQGRTALVIAHRLSTLVNMDMIFVFKQGKIIEMGTHQNLILEKGHYSELWRMQTKGFLPEQPNEQNTA